MISPSVPKQLSQLFLPISEHSLKLIETSLNTNFFSDIPCNPTDLHDHLIGRLNEFRNVIIPWLNDVRTLNGANILEIGCGTGSSTVALAEQGATVTAIDIVESSIKVAQDRCRAYGLQANFICANATEAHKVLAGQKFDFIIFFAALEHMTNSERIEAMSRTWEMLPPGGYWCIIESPNRLWPYDGHTALLPFYHWLPDDLAFAYSRFSSRENFGERFHSPSNDMLPFLRTGRGVSFHEFDLAIGSAAALDVVSCLALYRRSKSFAKRLTWFFSRQRRNCEKMLHEFAPNLHAGFFLQTLDLVIRKPL